jgi:hypothetical protein
MSTQHMIHYKYTPDLDAGWRFIYKRAVVIRREVGDPGEKSG